MILGFLRANGRKLTTHTVSPNNDMLDKMNRLFATFSEVDKAALGFPFGWENEPLWQ